MSRYEQVLHHIRYRNWHPTSFETRKFRIKCSELNGRYTSNEFNLEVSVSAIVKESLMCLPIPSFVQRTSATTYLHLPCSSQVSVLHEVRVSDKEHVNHLIVQPPFLQSVHHPESRSSIQRSSGRLSQRQFKHRDSIWPLNSCIVVPKSP